VIQFDIDLALKLRGMNKKYENWGFFLIKLKTEEADFFSEA
jgi:hypothetical protein